MTNVITSTSNAAEHCTNLPVDLMSKKLCLVYLFFRQWTGTTTMQKADYSVGKDGHLPPAQVTANYGQKRVIDPAHLRVFDTLKKRAETVLADAGLPFCKGTVIPCEKAAEVMAKLKNIADEYNRARDNFCATLDEKCREWIKNNPQFSAQLQASQPTAADVAQKINADYAVFRFTPAEAAIDQTNSLNRTVDGLFGEVIQDVAKRSRLLHKRSIAGKSADDLSQRTLSTLKVLKDKLTGLRFLDSGVTPIIDLIDRVLSLMPRRGKFSLDQYNALNASLGVLCDAQLLEEVARKKLTLNEHLAKVLPSLASAASAAPIQPVQPVDPVKPVETVAVETVEPVKTVEPEPCVGEPETRTAALPSCEEEKKQTGISAPDATALAATEPPETKEKSSESDFESLNRLLEMCYDEENEPEDDSSEPIFTAQDIPPAPAQIQLSTF